MNQPHPEEVGKAINDLHDNVTVIYIPVDPAYCQSQKECIIRYRITLTNCKLPPIFATGGGPQTRYFLSNMFLSGSCIKLDAGYFDGRCKRSFKYEDYICVEELARDVVKYINFVHTNHPKLDKQAKNKIKQAAQGLRFGINIDPNRRNMKLGKVTISPDEETIFADLFITPQRNIENITVTFTMNKDGTIVP